MATCNYIPESKQIPSMMKAVIDYVSREAKTVDEDGSRYLSGVNCAGTMAFDEFMATKNLFGKRDGWCFYHYEQSFAPGEITSYREAHEIGIELAKELFPHHEVLIGTHLDAYAENGEQRVHNHFVINSVSFEDGKKLHTGPRTLETMRKISDRICAEHQLSVLPEYKQKYGSKTVGTREYRATIKGDGWKFAAINDIETAMTVAGTKENFISLMESAGYAVNWSDTRKYITYTCPNGMKVRDIRLHENKFLKENMEHEFRIRQQYDTKQLTIQTQSGIENGASNDYGNTVSAHRLCDSEGGLECISAVSEGSDHLSAHASRTNFRADDQSGDGGYLGNDDLSTFEMVEAVQRRSDRLDGEYRPESQPSAFGNRARALTGWEDARRIFEEYQRGGGRTDLVFRGFDEETEPKDPVFPHRNGFGFGAVQRSDLSFDEIRSFFSDEEAVYDREAFEEEEPYTGSLRTLREQASMGNLYAIYRLSCVYLDPNHEKYNPKLGRRYLNEAARGGHAMAQYRLGKQYFYGIYVRCDMEYAEYWLTRSAQSENTPAKTLLGQAYVEGAFLNADRKKGVDLLCEAERNGNDHAAYTLGKLYMEGKHLKKDISKAIAHLEQAAEYGNFFAEYRLAQIYLFEADCFDMQKAVDYLTISAHKGNVHARNALRRMSEHTILSMTTDILDVVKNLPTQKNQQSQKTYEILRNRGEEKTDETRNR